MDTLIQLISDYGLWVVFVAVLLDQGGIPVPAWPPLVVASALAVENGEALWPIVLVATAAAVLADALWYAGGRRFGAQLIRLMCRLSLSPDTCVASTRGIYARWGAPSLVVAKFIPGFAAIGTTLAGQNRTPLARFALYDGLGAALWAGTAVALGAVFHAAISEVLATLESYGRYGLLAVLGALVLFVAWKAARRQLLLRQVRMARISVAELRQLFDEGQAPVVLDVRPHEHRLASGWIPGSIHAASVAELVLAPAQQVVVYCDCPNEISAARVAQELQRRGFRDVRPLFGGLDAWRSLGLPLDVAEVSR